MEYPVVKEHESPYATFANNPLIFRDPNGADSTKVVGGDRWMFTIEKGDNWGSISERVGVSVGDLKYFNQGNAAVENDHAMVPGTIIYISDPSCDGDGARTLTIDGGTLTILNYAQDARYEKYDPNTRNYTTKITYNSANLILYYSNPGGNTSGEYRIIQSFDTNDPLHPPNSSDYYPFPDADRPLNRPSGPMNDTDAGQRAHQKISSNKYVQWNPTTMSKVRLPLINSNSIGFFDSPSRKLPTSSGTITWVGYTQLQKNVNGQFVTIMTLTWGFTLSPNGTLTITNLTVGNSSDTPVNKRFTVP